MTTTAQIVRYLDDLLDTATVPDYPGAVNGLQLGNRGAVRRIAAAVDFSTRTVRGAVDAGADLLVVHHGMFWSGVQPITGRAYERIRLLLEHDVAVYSSHLPLDRHPLVGNNALLASQLGLEPSGEFLRHQNIAIGVRGDAEISTAELVERADRFARRHGGRAHATPHTTGRRTHQWAICTGAGASSESLREAESLGVDTLIVGEGPHHTAVAAEEMGIVVIYAGHYATETLGVQALASHLSSRFGVPWSFVEAPTGT